MRKNNTMRAAALLLALVLITSCFVGGTFAKYTTSVTDTDQARIAYWGFKQDGNTIPGWNFPWAAQFDLFDAEYDNTVKSGNGDNVVAPGTAKETDVRFIYAASGIEGVNAPEVDYNLTIAASITDHELLSNGTYGDRLDWSLSYNGDEATWYETHVDLLNAIAALTGTEATVALNEETGAWEVTSTGKHEAGTLPEFLTEDSTLTIGWKWDFPTTEDADEDVIDTFMGNLASEYDYFDNMVFTISITAEQVD